LSGDICRISYLCVSARARSQGVGAQLEERAASLARQRGCDRIELHCHERRTDAHRLYYRQRYVESPKYLYKSLTDASPVFTRPPVGTANLQPRARHQESMSLQIHEVRPADAPMELLLLADPSAAKLRAYLPHSKCFVASRDDVVVGACVVQALAAGAHELMSIAVHPSHQQAGHGSALLKWVIEHFRQAGASQLEVGTGSFGYQLAFYQR